MSPQARPLLPHLSTTGTAAAPAAAAPAARTEDEELSQVLRASLSAIGLTPDQVTPSAGEVAPGAPAPPGEGAAVAEAPTAREGTTAAQPSAMTSLMGELGVAFGGGGVGGAEWRYTQCAVHTVCCVLACSTGLVLVQLLITEPLSIEGWCLPEEQPFLPPEENPSSSLLLVCAPPPLPPHFLTSLPSTPTCAPHPTPAPPSPLHPAGTTATVEGAVSIMARSPSSTTAFAMGDLLFTLAIKEKEEGQEEGAVVRTLLRMLRCGPADWAACAGVGGGGAGEVIGCSPGLCVPFDGWCRCWVAGIPTAVGRT